MVLAQLFSKGCLKKDGFGATFSQKVV